MTGAVLSKLTNKTDMAELSKSLGDPGMFGVGITKISHTSRSFLLNVRTTTVRCLFRKSST